MDEIFFLPRVKDLVILFLRSPNGHLKFPGANSANREERARGGGPFPVMTK